ncbi:MAG: cupin domain-containing protein [Syntrophobacterales bacterium]|jgi:mannose-6-phosphate isomerase-like protein (cupin superfamily)|nr:cupin domain-containing protein [Syntrophobacterales bacterium]
MLIVKVDIEKLPTDGNGDSERRIFSNKGEMVQILNRANEAYKHLVYWDLDKAGQERGHHYHKRKTEHVYILSGEMELLLEDLESGIKETVLVQAGDRLTIGPKVAHAYRSNKYSQVLEYSPETYDASDTVPYKVAW